MNEPMKELSVRPCRVQDVESIDFIMREAWPDEPEWRNPQFWTKEFIKPSGQRFGYVIEQDEVMGFAIYKWNLPLHDHRRSGRYRFQWFFGDFNTDSFQWNQGINI